MKPPVTWTMAFVAGALAASAVFYGTSRRTPEKPAPVVAAVPLPAPAAAPALPAEPVKPPAPKAAAPKKAASLPAPPPAQITPPPAPPPPPEVPPEPLPIAAAPPPPQPQPPPSAEVKPAPQPEAPPEPRKPNTVTIAAGTLIPVRLNETLATGRNQIGDAFFATLDQPLVVDGFVIAERGAQAEGRVVDVLEPGRVRGTARLVVELIRFTSADGQKIDVRTATFVKGGSASKGADARTISIAAVIGAAIGAAAGGARGAAIGAAAGGAAGGGAVATGRGRAAVLDAETRISFRLEQPVVVTERR